MNELSLPEYPKWNPNSVIIIFVLLVYAILIIGSICHYELSLSSLFQISSESSYYQPGLLDKGTVVFKQGGYDGQFNYYMVKDFPLRGQFNNPFRCQRILYPFLCWLFSFGGYGPLLPAVFILINLVSIALGMNLLSLMLPTSSHKKMLYLLLYGLNPGFVTGVLFNLGTPLAMLLILAGYYYYKQNQLIPAVIMIALSLLTMENVILLLAPLWIWEMIRKNYRTGFILMTSLIPWAVWQLIVGWKLGKIPIMVSAGFLGIPGKGIGVYLLNLPHWFHQPVELIKQVSVTPLMLLVLLVLVFIGRRFYREKKLILGILLFHAAFALFLDYPHIWMHTITSSSRVLSGIFPFLFLTVNETEYMKKEDYYLIGLCFLLTMISMIRTVISPTHPYFLYYP